MPECDTCRSVFVAIVGKPNVGKSTLLNRLLGAKVAIVSSKPQTTRTRITGVLTEGGCQYVFLDTPGFHAPRNKLDQKMQQTVSEASADVDAALFLTWPKAFLDDEELLLLESLRAAHIPVILVYNKCDLAQSGKKADEQVAQLSALFPFDSAVKLSALTGKNCDGLLELLLDYSSEGPHFFPDDTLTDQPERVIAGEMVREQLLLQLFDELPHGCGVVVEQFSERDSGLIDISAVIYCERESHKGMIIGKGGSKLKAVGTAARESIEQFLGARVNLQLHVKVKEAWRNNESVIKYLGY